MRVTFLSIFSFIVSTGLFAQSNVVYGKLTAFNRYPLKNIEVSARKSQAATTTDSLGRFSLVCEEKDVIRIRPKAFRPVNRRVGPETDTLTVNLIFVDSRSNRKRATGYGYIDEDDLTYALEHLEYENNDFCNYTSVFDLIEGRFAGVTVQRNGMDGEVYIRGGTSINLSNEALYVVDGNVTSSIGLINPCDVKSIDVLKDGMAAAYGSRGANGVVIIETRMGGN